MKSLLPSCAVAMLATLFSFGSEPKANAALPQSVVSEKTIVELVDKLAPASPDTALMERGIRACASLWRPADCSEEDFKEFVSTRYENTAEGKRRLHDHLSAAFEALAGCGNDLQIRLQRPTILDGDEPLEVDYILSGYNSQAHQTEDLFANKIAFITMLNFPFYTLAEKNEKGMEWSPLEWAYARMGDMFTDRADAAGYKASTEANAKAENYIASYNIMMGHLLTEDGERLFPEGMSLLSHWNLRDEIKADYADSKTGLKKQEMIFKVMEHIVLQTIPECVINNPEYDWKPFSNTVWKDGKKVEAGSEACERYARILDIFHASLAADPYFPQMPTAIVRNFEGDMELSADRIESLFLSLISSPEVKQVGKLIQKRLGRKLRPFDIWYDGFKSRATMSEDSLSAQTRALYPDAAAFKKGMPQMLCNLGFSEQDAEFISSKIEVEPARGSGHAWPTLSRFQPSLLRTRIGADGMDYKGYNIAVHEFGHNVEETMDMYFVPFYMLSGIPNSALTETMAFVFQKRDLQLLGYPAAKIDENTTLDIFWGAYEIMGVALTDMYVWRWLYENKEATAEDLRDATVRIAKDVWNKYYEPVLGSRDCPLLAIYSHMVSSPMYLPNYPFGHLVEYQVEEFLSKFRNPSDFAAQLKRIWSQGRLTPDIWMKKAVGTDVSVTPLVNAAKSAATKTTAR